MSNSIRRKFKRNRKNKQFSLDDVLAIHDNKLMTLQNCILCGAPPGNNRAGIFKIDPEHSHRYGGIPGRRRLQPYSICNACFKRPDKLVEVEAALAAGVDAIIQAASDIDNFCIACDGLADMLHVARANKVYGTCQHCLDTKDNLVAIVTGWNWWSFSCFPTTPP